MPITEPGVLKHTVIGAVVGAVIGVLIGLLIHSIRNSDGALWPHELAGGLSGLVLGAVLGAFYAGALRLPRRD